MTDSQRRIDDALATVRRAGLRVMEAQSGTVAATEEAQSAVVKADAAARNAAAAGKAAQEALLTIAATMNILDPD